jgi:UDPglucose 6-dehydrogenase
VKVAVLGLWHLGSVTAACLASAGHVVRAFDPEPRTVAALAGGQPPVAEPGLSELIARGLQSGALQFTQDLSEAVRDADVVWVTFDTPVDEEDVADVAYVERHIENVFPYLADGAVLLCSSQLPVGTMRKLERRWMNAAAGRTVSFACTPENLRLGKAIELFTNPDRVVVGVCDEQARTKLQALLAPIADRIQWMSVESAEMTKHAINAFLATSVAFINELASLCERAGADAKEVERGLRTERRIGPHAYLSPGGAFAGGTLARDVSFLRELGTASGLLTPLMDGVLESNRAHGLWVRRHLETELGALAGSRIAIWGLTYKPGTDTLRRSPAVDLSRWLAAQGADLHVHDPAVRTLPAELVSITRHLEPIDAAAGARALVVATEWPIYRQIDVERLAAKAPGLVVLDANRFLAPLLDHDPRFRFIAVGQPQA